MVEARCVVDQTESREFGVISKHIPLSLECWAVGDPAAERTLLIRMVPCRDRAVGLPPSIKRDRYTVKVQLDSALVMTYATVAKP